MKYLYIYSGSQAAFVFSGLAVLANGVPITIDEATHSRLLENKFAKHLIESGELVVQEIEDPNESKLTGKTGGRGGKGGGGGKAAADAAKAAEDAALATVKAELTELEVTFSEDETLEQLQAKLNQAKE